MARERLARPHRVASARHAQARSSARLTALLSVGFGGTGPPAPGSTGRQRELREITFSSKVGEHSSKLFRAALDGKPMAVEVILTGAGSTLRLKLENAIVGSYNTSGDGDDAVESWVLNFESMEQSSEGE